LTLALFAAMCGLCRQVHSLPVLLCLEGSVIICYVSMVAQAELVFAAVLLRVGAVEGAVGLACLVGLVRAAGRGRVAL